jgi:hypothetical protein
MAHVELLDPFGAVLAEGDLTARDIPGVDELTPSAADEFARFAGQRLTLSPPDGYSPPGPYSIRVG